MSDNDDSGSLADVGGNVTPEVSPEVSRKAKRNRVKSPEEGTVGSDQATTDKEKFLLEKVNSLEVLLIKSQMRDFKGASQSFPQSVGPSGFPGHPQYAQYAHYAHQPHIPQGFPPWGWNAAPAPGVHAAPYGMYASHMTPGVGFSAMHPKNSPLEEGEEGLGKTCPQQRTRKLYFNISDRIKTNSP